MVSFNLTVGAVEPHHLSQCPDPMDDLDSFFPSRIASTCGKTNRYSCLSKATSSRELERYQLMPFRFIMDGSRDDYYRSGSEIYIKTQDYNLRIQRRNPDSCSVFCRELIAID
ncbi:uncharacterized protein TNCV_3397601 [Trichonephila clavipes]|nr:uncharacterized protein TNCV_3397601 [Trichonephila clavipes]